uniref:ethanolamine kinase n=1 Tax=Micrurus surinamensis TaxID=129470 RepID=A0A2D4PP01_MICSU
MAWMKERLSNLGSPVVLCHNDVLCKNIIYNGKQGDVQFIDYEYSGYNYLAYDIGNHFNEFAGTVVTWLLMAWTLVLHQDWMSASQCSVVQIEPLLRFVKTSFARHGQVL